MIALFGLMLIVIVLVVKAGDVQSRLGRFAAAISP